MKHLDVLREKDDVAHYLEDDSKAEANETEIGYLEVDGRNGTYHKRRCY